MKNALKDHYEIIRKAIVENIDSMGKLFKQAEDLRKVADQLGTEEQKKLKQGLETSISAIEDGIKQLADNTEDLFLKYKRFLESL